MTEPTATHPTAAHPAGTRNPGPRPALLRRADDDTVISARPRAGTAPETADALEAPAPGAGRPDAAAPTTMETDTKERDKEKLKAGRDDRASKDGKKHKDGHRAKAGKSAKHSKDHRKEHHQDAAVSDERGLSIVLPKAVRRALNDSAAAHGTTPERLVALVLSEWLDH
jgi:hypothetical protein